MRPLQSLQRRPVGFNMTPMIDVVFLLIIFFLVSSQLSKRENRIPVELPNASSGQPSIDEDVPRLTLTLQSNGELWLSGRQVPVADLTKRLEARRAQAGDQLELRVRCDRTVPYRDVAPVLSAAATAGVWNVSFAVLEPKRGAL